MTASQYMFLSLLLEEARFGLNALAREKVIFRTSPVCISEVPALSFLIYPSSFTDCTQFYYSFFPFSLFDLKHIKILSPHSTLI